MSGEELKRLRASTGMGQAEFARWLGIQANHLYKLESGTLGPDGEPLRPSKTLERLALLITEKKNREKIVSLL